MILAERFTEHSCIAGDSTSSTGHSKGSTWHDKGTTGKVRVLVDWYMYYWANIEHILVQVLTYTVQVRKSWTEVVLDSIQTSDVAGHSAGSAGQNIGTTYRSRMHALYRK